MIYLIVGVNHDTLTMYTSSGIDNSCLKEDAHHVSIPRKGRSSPFFENYPRKAFTEIELLNVFYQRSTEWRLAVNTTNAQFLRFMLENTALRQVWIVPGRENSNLRSASRYVWGNASPYAVAATIERGAYLSHGTAVLLHGLTDQLPQTIYVNREQTSEGHSSGKLTQEGIDRAFSHQPRTSNALFTYEQSQILLMHGKNTGRLEVGSVRLDGEQVPVTKLERTLIDITVRPVYGGGVYQVFQAYRTRQRKNFYGHIDRHSSEIRFCISVPPGGWFLLTKGRISAKSMGTAKSPWGTLQLLFSSRYS